MRSCFGLILVLNLVAVVSPGLNAPPPAEALSAGDLRCEYLRDPLGVDAVRPRLSWVVRSTERGQRQTAYRVQVASDEELLAAGKADLWDSGRVESDQSIGVEYAGKPPASGQACFWRVKVWGRGGVESPWSKVGRWEMGLLRASDWTARWINDGKRNPQSDADFYDDDPAPLLRKAFRVDKPVRRARLYICGLGYYEASINGRRVGDHVLDPAWTDYAKRVFYSTYDVTDLLRPGDNAIGVILGNGWYNPLPLRMWGHLDLREYLTVGRPRLIAQLRIEYTDGSLETVVTDRTWKHADGPILRNNIYLGEVYDARREQPGWNRPGFDDSSWQPVGIAKEPIGPLRAQPLPPVRPIGRLKAASMTEPKPGVYIFDLGRNFAGWARLRVHGPAGTRITMRFGELLHEDGTLNVMTSVCGQIKRKGMGGPGAPPVAYASDVYVLKGDGEEVYTPRFTFHGFRYVEVTGYPGKPTLESVEGIALASDVESAGEFSCSNEVVNRIQAMVRNTFRSNMFTVQSDCPQRERFGYGGDIVASCDAFMLNFDMAAFYSKAVVDFADAARPNGALTETAPFVGIAAGGYGGGSGPIGWAIVHPLLLRELYRYYGDRRLIEQQYEVARRWFDFEQSHAKDDLIDKGISDHESLVRKPVPVTGTAFYYQAASLLADLAKTIDRNDDARRYKALAKRIRASFVEKFMADKTGKVEAGTQACQAIALFHGLAPENRREDVFARLIEAIEARDGKLSTGIFATKYMLDVLSRYGRADLAWHIVTQPEFPGWAHMLRLGATTLWEHWKFSDNTYSHNHPMFGSVSEWFFRHLAGINPAPDAVGFDRIVIRPQIVGDLEWVKGRYESIRGTVESRWRRDDEQFTLTVEVPVGVTARVYVPAQDPETVSESGRPAGKSEGVRAVGTVEGAAIFEVGSGRYSFSVPRIAHVERHIEGWTVHVDKRLLGTEKELGDQALRILADKLYEIKLVVPEAPLKKLQEVPIWIDLDHKLGIMQYHPEAKWLKDHGYDTAMAKAVHIPNARRFVNGFRRNNQPSVVMHELAHAYHDRVLGFDYPEIKEAYRQAVKDGRYDSVLHISGRMRRHYALTDHKEYFAEGTEAFFGTNDFYPFVRAELEQHDPKLYGVLEKVWQTKPTRRKPKAP